METIIILLTCAITLIYTYFSCKRLKEDIIAIDKLLNDRINFNCETYGFHIKKIQKELEALKQNTTKEKKK